MSVAKTEWGIYTERENAVPKVLNYVIAEKMKNQEDDEKNELVKKLSMADGAYNNMIALPLVMLFEVLMTISWVVM